MVLRVRTADNAGAVVQRGAIGRVVGDDGGRYRVELPDGRRTTVTREEVSLRADWQRTLAGGAPELVDPAALVRDRTVYAAVIGSRAYGLDVEGSDTDVRGVYVAPTAAFWSLSKPPPHVDGPGETFSWELERFCELALRANPNLLEVLHSPLVVTCTPLGQELLALRPAFLSQLAHQTYAGYVLSQFRKLQADLRTAGEPRWKHVMHLLRLLLAVRDLMATGRPVVDVGEHREQLLAVRRGEVAWEEVEAWRRRLHAEVDAAVERSPLPPGPDVGAVDAWLRDVRRRDLQAEPPPDPWPPDPWPPDPWPPDPSAPVPTSPA